MSDKKSNIDLDTKTKDHKHLKSKKTDLTSQNFTQPTKQFDKKSYVNANSYYAKSLRKGDGNCVILGGCRSAFVKSFGKFYDLEPLELFSRVVEGLIDKLAMDPMLIDEIIAGAVIPQISNPNIARDTILNLKLPNHIHGFTLNQACASSLQSIALGSKTIATGKHPHFILAGGVECLSQVPICYSSGARKTLVALSRAKNLAMKFQALKKFKIKDFLPNPPSLTEPLTGLTMGQHVEIMAEKNSITRLSQDEFSVSSHQKAYKAFEMGYLSEEIIPIIPPKKYNKWIDRDDLIRKDTTIKALSKLKPAFKKPYGTLTAGNSSALTDGAAVTLIADKQRSISLGFKPLAEIVDMEFVGCDPYDQLLIGPALAIPRILKRNRLKISDIDRFEFHEAFAAQVLSCQKALSSLDYFEKFFGASQIIGSIPENKLNVNGGAIAIGHPFAASGSRLVNCLVAELKRSNLQWGLVSMCASGGLAGCMLIKNISD